MALSVCAVILVGGKGKRLRPLSTSARPKAFLSITRDRKPIFARTLDRARKIVPSNRIVVVANRVHARLVKKDFPAIASGNLLLEPASRNTGPAIAYAAARIKSDFKDAVMVILPADQYIAGEARYIAAIKRGIGFTKKKKGALLVLGVRPEFPSTEFGYIRVESVESKVEGVYKVGKFTEKPDSKTAEKFVRDGRHLWNAGAFVFTAAAILKNIEDYAPKIADAFNVPDEIDEVYERLPDISIDYAVMERAANIYCVEGAYGWRDVGNFDSLKKTLRAESRRFVEDGTGKVLKIL